MSSGPARIRLLRTAQEAEAVLQDLEHAFAVDAAAGAGVCLEDQEDDVLLARTGDAFLDAEVLGQRHQRRWRLALEFVQVDQRCRCAAASRSLVGRHVDPAVQAAAAGDGAGRAAGAGRGRGGPHGGCGGAGRRRCLRSGVRRPRRPAAPPDLRRSHCRSRRRGGALRGWRWRGSARVSLLRLSPPSLDSDSDTDRPLGRRLGLVVLGRGGGVAERGACRPLNKYPLTLHGRFVQRSCTRIQRSCTGMNA